MDLITFGVLTISDRCSLDEGKDESGPNLAELVVGGVVPKGMVSERAIVPDNLTLIQKKIKEWSDDKGIHVILTTGGTGLAESDVTPEAVRPLLDKEIPGITHLILTKCTKITPLACLSRSVCGTRGKSLIITLPGSKKGAQECFEAVAGIIKHAVDLVRDAKWSISDVHARIQTDTAHSKVCPTDVAGRSRRSGYELHSVEEAERIIELIISKAENQVSLPTSLPISKCLGYVLAKSVQARNALPQWPTSIKDGYAVLSSDPSTMKTVVTSFSAGDVAPSTIRITPGFCARVSTGAPVPQGADAVVQVEDTELVCRSCDGKDESKVLFQKAPRPFLDIREPGSDFKAGQVVLEERTLLGACELGVLAAVGETYVLVYDKPRICVLSTGNELAEPDQDLTPGKIRDSNRVTIMALLEEQGFSCKDLGIARDTPDELYAALRHGFATADVVVTTGSMSMGERDYLKRVLVEDFDANIHIGRIFMKPGKPTAFASLKFDGRTKFWFGLPGNPVSAVVTSTLFLIPAVRKISGYKKPYWPRITARLTEDIHLDDRPEYRRAVLSHETDTEVPSVTITGNQISSRLLSCVSANCLLELPSASETCTTMAKGSLVSALLVRLP